MTIHEFGQGNPETVVLIHPSVVMWDYFEYVIPLMQGRYHLVIPALPGYDTENQSDFTSVEEIAAQLTDWLKDHGCDSVACIYGCSMGGSVVARFIAIKDFLLISMGKLGGLKILEKAFSTDEYSEEDLQYIVKALKHMSAKTIWRTFESCNNYDMPDRVKVQCGRIEYWYARAEEKDRKSDIAYIRKIFPQTEFKVFDNIGHGGLATLKPELLVKEPDPEDIRGMMIKIRYKKSRPWIFENIKY